MYVIFSYGLIYVVIIDFDFYYGDGFQFIVWLYNVRFVGLGKNVVWWKKILIGYFSLYDINFYLCEMGDEDKVRNVSICIDNVYGQSIWNVYLQLWKIEIDFWVLYEFKYLILLDKIWEYLRVQIEKLCVQGVNLRVVIFLFVGFDVSEWESFGM